MRDATVLMVMYDLWAYRFRNRKHQIAEYLSRREWVREVIFCEPPLPSWVTRPDGRRQLEALDAGFCGGAKDRCEGLLGATRTAGGRLLSVTPKLQVFAPEGVGAPEPRAPLWRCYGPGDEERILASVRALLAERNAGDVLLWMHSPFLPNLLDGLLYRSLVYDCTDDYTHFLDDPDEQQRVRDTDVALARRADLTLAVSAQLVDGKRRYSDRVYELPNGCEFHHFAKPAPAILPEEIAGLNGPILGYFGRADLRRKLDYPLLMFLAMRHPEWQIVLIGPPRPDQSELRLPNIHFLGHQNYERLPQFASAFDVCLVPHRVGPLTDNMDPIKLYEYLATGKPVVTTRVAGTARFDGEIAVCDSWTEFENAVSATLRQPGEGRDRRLAAARAASWDHRLADLGSLLDRHCRSPKLGEPLLAQSPPVGG